MSGTAVTLSWSVPAGRAVLHAEAGELCALTRWRGAGTGELTQDGAPALVGLHALPAALADWLPRLPDPEPVPVPVPVPSGSQAHESSRPELPRPELPDAPAQMLPTRLGGVLTAVVTCEMPVPREVAVTFRACWWVIGGQWFAIDEWDGIREHTACTQEQVETVVRHAGLDAVTRVAALRPETPRPETGRSETPRPEALTPRGPGRA